MGRRHGMGVSGIVRARGRRALVVAGALALGLAGVASGLQASPAPPQAAAQDALLFTCDNVHLYFSVKAEKADDFESVWSTIKTKLSASSKDELKAQGASINLMKVDGPPVNGAVFYFMV